jgi:hypothetical protein
MRRVPLILNIAGLAVSFFCFLHCVLVILVFAGLLKSNLLLIKIFEDPSNHAALILTGLTLAALSLIKFRFSGSMNTDKGGRKLKLKVDGLLSTRKFIVGASLLGLSFLFAGIYSELLVILGALTLLSIHATKLLKTK